jgi:hypothetical protein
MFAGFSSDQIKYFSIIRKASKLSLGKDKITINRDLKYSARAGNKYHLDI